MFTTKKGTAAARNYGYRLANAIATAIEGDAKSVYQIAKDAGIRESDLLQFLGGETEPYTRHQAMITQEQASAIAYGLTNPAAITIAPFDLTVTAPGGMSPAHRRRRLRDYVEFANAVKPVSWTISSGALPGGLSIATATAPNENRGTIAGTPTAPTGTYAFTAKGTDQAGVERSIATSIVLA